MKQNRDAQIKEALSYDALAEAEKATGQSYKEDKLTAGLGFINHLLASDKKRKLLQEEEDSYWGIPSQDFRKLIEQEGFKLALEEPFVGRSFQEPVNETYCVYFHPCGILMSFDTYGKGINGGSMYYCWEPNDKDDYWKCVESGSCDEIDGRLIHYGSSDVREGVRFKLRKFRSHGKFVAPWISSGHLWLLHYQDVHDIEAKHGRHPLGEFDSYILAKWERLCPEAKAMTAKAGDRLKEQVNAKKA